MREIKFISRHKEGSIRAHGEISNRWGFNEYGYYHTNGMPSSEYIQCQFTGMKDKNGDEIYEGDIVNCNRFTTQEDHLVVVQDIRNIPSEMQGSNLNYMEVLGNIYEHPHLLNTDNG